MGVPKAISGGPGDTDPNIPDRLLDPETRRKRVEARERQHQANLASQATTPTKTFFERPFVAEPFLNEPEFEPQVQPRLQPQVPAKLLQPTGGDPLINPLAQPFLQPKGGDPLINPLAQPNIQPTGGGFPQFQPQTPAFQPTGGGFPIGQALPFSPVPTLPRTTAPPLFQSPIQKSPFGLTPQKTLLSRAFAGF